MQTDVSISRARSDCSEQGTPRILHAAFFLQVPVGVERQMKWEQEAADKLGITWRSIIFAPFDPKVSSTIISDKSASNAKEGHSFLRRAEQWWRLRLGFANWVRRESLSYDVILLRYSMANPLQSGLVKDLIRMGKPTYLVHHTKEIDEIIGKGGVQARFKAALEGILARGTLRAATGLIAVTNEIAQYEAGRAGAPLVSHRYPNGIRMASDPVADARRDPPELLFVASEFVGWHGLDLLLDAFERSNEPCVLHLVGKVGESDSARAESDPRIRLHGLLDSGQIRGLAAQSSIGLGSFALHRNNMREACTLKVREYLALGLPVYSGYTDVFPPDFPYYCEGAISLEAMIDFARARQAISRGEVRTAAQPYIDKVSLVQNLYESIASPNRAPRSHD